MSVRRSLSLAAAAAAGAQLKKKSGFQITSVTPAAQMSAASLSSNNSIAEDTESYDDLDESHTEDLSSSEILDVSLSRATDLGEPGRSSSEETLNNFQEAETPGALSPNQPRLPPPAAAAHPPLPPHLLLLNGARPPLPPPPGSPSARKPAAEGPAPAASSARAALRAAPGLAAAASSSSSSGGSSPLPPGHVGASLGKGGGSPGGPGNGALSGPALGNSGSPAGSGPPPAAAAAPSRFRVVKLDSSSEPFRKGRWTCTEFYDKEGPGAAGEAAAATKALEALRQSAPAEGPSERESPCGSSLSSSSLSTLSHYTESAGSGEMAAAAAEFLPGLPHSASQSQLHQEAAFPPQKPPPLQQHQHQLPYAQPAAPGQPQQLPYGGAQAQQIPVQMAPGHMNSLPGPDYIQQQQQMLQAPLSSMRPGPALVGTGAQPVPAAPAPSGQPSGLAPLAVAPPQPVACVQTPMPPPAAGAGLPVLNASQPGALPPVVQQPLVANQMAPPVMPQNVAPSQVMPSVPAGLIPPGSQAGTSGLPPPLGIAPQAILLPAQSQLQSGEPLVPGMAGQQVPAISPGPAMGAMPISGHCAANVPPPPVSLAPSKNTAPSSAVQNENLAQKLPQSSLTPASINLPMPPLNSAPFSAQSLPQPSAGRSEEARRSTDPLLVGIAQPLGSESGAEAPSALSDGPSSMAASLFPLKGLPLTAQLMDGEDDG
ncbi:UNVERIFIED_CONTAM: hypothetical protein K2H54_007833 [Gekko kuhli]